MLSLSNIVQVRVNVSSAPASGSADIIVDITSTGSTLKANHLKILDDGVVLKSQACLVRARKAEHEDNRRIAEIVAAVKAAV